MMKKLVVLLMVLGAVSVANATIIDVVAVDIGQSEGRLGGVADPLMPSDVIGLSIVLNSNPYPGYPSYDGYVTDGIDLDLHVSGPGTLDVPGIYDKTGVRIGDDLKYNSGFDLWSQSGPPLIVGNSIAQMSGASLGYIVGAQDLVWNLLLHCDGDGDVLIDLTLNGLTQIYDYWGPAAGLPYTDPYAATEGDLGDLVIHQVPEPMTLALLGLGGLFLRRRK